MLEERTLLTTFIVTSANGGTGPGTLYNAIAQANADTVSSLPDTILFNIQGDGLHTIALTEELPHIKRPMDIEGDSQPGYVPGTGSTLGKPVIQLDGNAAGQVNGLEQSTPGTV